MPSVPGAKDLEREILTAATESRQLKPMVSVRSWSLAFVIGCLAVAGCSSAADSDLSRTARYQGAVGSEYRTKTALHALGLKSSADPNQVEMIWVSPFPGTDSNIAFRRTIPVGHVFRVMAIRKRFVLLDNGLQFVVATEGLDLPRGVEIVIPLYGYMESSNGFPDPKTFELVSSGLRR